MTDETSASDSAGWVESPGVPNRRDDWLRLLRKSAIVFSGLVGAAILWTGISQLWRVTLGPRDVHVQLSGCGVSQLKPGAFVVLGTTVVGEVTKCDNYAGVTELRIDKDYAAQVPCSSQFEVDSLNTWMPGNLGVRIRAPMVTNERAIADGARIQAVERVLPAVVPERFYWLIASCAGGLIVLIVLARVLRSLLLFALGCGAILAVAFYLHGTITPP